MSDRVKALVKALIGVSMNVLSWGYFGKARRLRKRYLDLMQSCLAGVIYEDAPYPVLGQMRYDSQTREFGYDWPSLAHTMIGSRRLANVRNLAEYVVRWRIPGDLIETGVWRGGACIMMRAVLEAYKVKNRRVWLADSFEGLPVPDTQRYPADAGSKFHEYEELSVPLEAVKENFRKYGLLDEQVVFLKGWFKNTLPTAPIERLALLRLDGDLYESTIVPLEALYDKLSVGGFVIVDDYHVVAGCKRAIQDFCASRKITPAMVEIDGVGVYWRKSRS